MHWNSIFITAVCVIFLIGLGVYLRNLFGCGPLIGENKCVADAECHVETVAGVWSSTVRLRTPPATYE